MDRGFIKLYRKALDSGLIQHAKAWQLLSWCLLKATHRPFKTCFNGVVFELEPGQLVTSRDEACAFLFLTPKEFRCAAKLLEKTGFLAHKGTSRGTVFTVVNWGTHQAEGAPSGPSGGPRKGREGAGSGPAAGVSSVYRQEQDNRKKEYYGALPDRPVSSGRPSAECAEDVEGEYYLTKTKRTLAGKRLAAFNRFWTAFAYPKGKADAADAWLDIPLLTDSLVRKIVEAAEHEAAARPGVVASGRSPKWAEGWLAGRRWEDERSARARTKTLEELIAEQGVA